MNNKKFTIWLPLFISIAMAVGMYIGYYMRDAMPNRKFFSANRQKTLEEILTLVQNKYVDDVKINELTDTAIEAMLSKLDPHSNFIPAKQLQAVNEDLSGKFYGIGVEYNVFNDTIIFTNVLQDGPSYKAGVQPGDKLIKVNDSVVAGVKVTTEKIIGLLRGDRGTTANLQLLSEGKLKAVPIIRDVIPIISVDASYMADSVTAYIHLNRFSSQTYREFMLAMEKYKKEGMKKLVLDLRGNGGGILDDAVQMADEFLSGDKLITYTEGKHFKPKEYRCKRPGIFEEGKLVVLIDEGTASASEVLCGALQDYDRATIVGRRSFGKGLVQEQYSLSDGSALRLTIARYFTPSGRSIQRPYTHGEKAYYEEVSSRIKNGEKADSVKQDTAHSYKTAGGRKVFGGGGITPDIFVAADSSYRSINQLLEKGTISRYAIDYYLQNKKAMMAYKSPEDFAQNFTLNTDAWKGLELAAKKDSISATGITNNVNAGRMFKASLARVRWRNNGYYQSLNAGDKALQKAFELVK